MCKVQIYITLLLKKKYKTIVFSGCLLIASWLIYILMVGGNPFSQIMEILGQSREKSAEFIWFGILDGLTKFGASGTVAMVCSMIVGILFTICMTILVLKSKYRNNSFVLFSIPAFVSTIWCYKSEPDLMVLILPSLLICFAYYEWNNKIGVLLGMVYLAVFNVKIFTGGVRRLVGYDWLVGRNIDAWIRLLLFVVVIFVMIKKNNLNDYMNKERVDG